jgi:hypothetical protein
MIVSPEFYLCLAGLVAAVMQVQVPHFAAYRARPRFHIRTRTGRIAGWTGMALMLVSFAPGPAHAEDAGFIAGVDTHFAQAPETDLQGMRLLRSSAFTSLRDEVYWANVETLPGYLAVPLHWTQYIEDAHAQGVRPLLVLDYGNKLYDHGDKPRSAAAVAAFARYAGTIAAKFRGKVKMYEVWNEWSNSLGHTSPGTMVDYLPLLHASAVAIRAADPAAHVLADGILWSDGAPGVIEQAIQSGALRDADGITLHPYFYNRGTDHSPEAWARYVQEVEDRMRLANGDKPVPIYLTEIGWPNSNTKNGIAAGLQAAYAARVYLLSQTMPFMGGLWWYDLRDDGLNPGNDQENFGLARPDFTPKPAFRAVADTLKRLTGAHYVGPLANPPDKVTGLVFSGKHAFRAIWSTDDAAHTVSIGGRTLQVGAMPIFIDGDSP